MRLLQVAGEVVEEGEVAVEQRPLALNVVFEQIVRGKDMDVKSVFDMEYKIS